MVNMLAEETPMQISDYQTTWETIQTRLRDAYGDGVFKSWLQGVEFADVQQGCVTLSAPNRVARDRISQQYLRTIRTLWKEACNHVKRVEVLVSDAVHVDTDALGSSSATAGQQQVLDFTFRHVEDTLSSPLDPRFTFDSFIVGDSNKLAFKAAKAIAQGKQLLPGTSTNPLFLHGGVGLGKTHLMHAIAHEIRTNNPSCHIIYLSAEKFMYHFIRALKNNNLIAFKEQFRAVDVLMVDDIQFISGKSSTLEEFFHTFNDLIDNNRQVIISCDRSPSDLEGMGERARSRLGWGLVADINDTSEDLRYNILKAKAGQLGTDVPDDVLNFLAQSITSNTRELEGSLNKVIAFSNLMELPIDITSARQVLKDVLKHNQKQHTIDGIQKRVMKRFHLTMSDLSSSKRTRTVARPRQIAMYLCKQHTTKSFIEIGRAFGGKDHTTVMHAVKKVEALMKEDQEIFDIVQELATI